MSLLNQYVSGPSKREREAAEGSDFSKFTEACRQSSQLAGVHFKRTHEFWGMVAGRIVMAFLFLQWDSRKRKGEMSRTIASPRI
jgi:hypothetical protein